MAQLTGREHSLPVISSSRYTVKLAEDIKEVQAALRLRYEIFGKELDRISEVNESSSLEQDQFDDQFHHLIVLDKGTNEVIGTYRLQTYGQASNGLGFTTNFRFYLEQFPPDLLKNAVEAGRACIAKEHRSGMVLYLLWKGLATYLRHFGKGYLFGYAALDTTNPQTAFRTYAYLKQQNHLHTNIWIERRQGFTEPWPHHENGKEVDIPLLFQHYLNVGSKVCGGPSFDHNYRLIHFLILLDVNSIPDQTRKMFLDKIPS
jgi:putative hemolysin